MKNQQNTDLILDRTTLTSRQATLCPDVDLHLEVQVAVVSLLLHQWQHLGFLLLWYSEKQLEHDKTYLHLSGSFIIYHWVQDEPRTQTCDHALTCGLLEMHDVIVDMNVKLEILHYTLCYARLGRKQQEARKNLSSSKLKNHQSAITIGSWIPAGKVRISRHVRTSLTRCSLS